MYVCVWWRARAGFAGKLHEDVSHKGKRDSLRERNVRVCASVYKRAREKHEEERHKYTRIQTHKEVWFGRSTELSSPWNKDMFNV